MSVGVFTNPIMLGNVTHSIFNGLGSVGGPGPDGLGGGVNGGLDGAGGGHRIPLGKNCTDLNQRLIPHGVHFVPGPDACTLCACDDGEPKWCKAVLCSPPSTCKSFRVGNSCCEFICLDDSLNGGPNTGGPYLSRPVEIANFVPKVVIAAVTVMLSLSLLFFLIHRLRQKHIQGRLNSARARRSTQMCDECDDTRSLDFSNDFFEHRMNSPHLYPPQYLAWWKPPSSYFPPRGEAPPPYEEAVMTTTSLRGNTALTTTIVSMPPCTTATTNINNNSVHNSLTGGGVFNDIPIIVSPPVLAPGLLQGTGAGQGRNHSSPAAIQRLASAIANSSGGGVTAATTGMSTSTSASSHNARGNFQGDAAVSGKGRKSKSKSSKNKERTPAPQSSAGGEPRPGPSRLEIDTADIHGGSGPPSPRSFRIHPPPHGPPPPTYEDAIYSLHTHHSHDHAHHPRTSYFHPHSHHHNNHRHSLTLPPRRFISTSGSEISSSSATCGNSHLYPRVLIHGSSTGGSFGGGGGGAGPLTCYTEEEILRRAQLNQNQRYSLQFNVSGEGDGCGSDNGGGGVRVHSRDVDWSSSSSTLSLSTSPNSPVGGRAPSLSSSSESSVSENPPPPPAPSSNSPRA